jgi:hypothetical protein
VNHAQATGSFSPVIDATSRLGTGDGAMIMVEVGTGLSAGSNVFTLTYTNQAGTGSRTTPQVSTVASAIADRVPYANGTWFVPFQDGDFGARSIEGWTLVSGTATGTLCISLIRPMAMMGVVSRALNYERDFMVQLPWLPELYDDACLAFVMSQFTTGSDPLLGGIGILAK